MNPIKLNDNILLKVRKPARYIGEEHNIIKKAWKDNMVKLCLCYPDVYEIGMSNLGLRILYHILNRREDVLCERSFAPWIDMEEVMRREKLPLFSLETKAALSEFDIIGFSLQYELTYTNLLNMLDLACIPIKSSERQGRDFPIIIAGGSCAFNPGPLSDFIDLFLIGDAEEAVIDLAQAYKNSQNASSSPGARPTRADINKEFLKNAAKIDGVYVPSIHKNTRTKVKRRIIKELRYQDYPVKPVVPYISIIHDRIALEIMRGCPHQCHFCQARKIYHPVRLRKSDDIISLAKQAYNNTGFDEFSLISLSSANYPDINTLLEDLVRVFEPLGVGISLPSLRIEDKLDKLPYLISRIKKTGFTFAPEVGTERMLQVINKNICFDELFEALKKAYKMGWQRVKLYFMIGLPQETEEDLRGIIEVSDKAAILKREFSKYPAEITVSVSSFIPKPHTFFERCAMQSAEELKRKQEFLIDKARGKRYLKLKFHDVNISALEGVFSRGDEKLGQVLLHAYKSGARFDAWDECFNPNIWQDAFSAADVDRESYLAARTGEDALPWAHVEV